MYSNVKGYIDNFTDYFSDYDESHITLWFYWDISLHVIKSLRKIYWSFHQEEKQIKVIWENKIEIFWEIMNKINNKYFYSRQKGRVFSVIERV